MIYILRNLWWKLGHWNNRTLRKWLDEFDAQCVFFVSGDYGFMYDIARKIARMRNIPLYISCMDDYYFSNKNQDRFLGRFQHRRFMKAVQSAMDDCAGIFCICDAMASDYEQFFHKKAVTIHTGASFEGRLEGEKKRKISYIGALGLERHRQLVDIGRALKSLHRDIDHIDVYAIEPRKEILKEMTMENGIVFHGGIGAEEVRCVMAESLALIHTESFDGKIRDAVRYSVSTKIAESLMSGTCIFAYGPKEIASMRYLADHQAACCAFSREELTHQLVQMMDNEGQRGRVIENALALARKNHQPDRNYQLLCHTLHGRKSGT